MRLPIVSIIVPCYNQACFLPETLESVLKQTSADWECVIVNDGSLDNTEDVAREYCNKDARFHYEIKENGGLASARNYGIEHSHGEYILPLDSDDLIGEDFVAEILTRFHSFPETSLVACKGEKFGASTGPCFSKPYSYDALLRWNCFVCTSAFKREDFDRIGGYNTNMKHGMEDWDFWLSLLSPESIVYTIDKVLFFYRQKEVSMYTEMTPYYEENLRQIVKNHPDVYKPYMEEILWLWKKNSQLEAENYSLSHSLPYRIGFALLKPYRMLKSLLKKKK